MKTILSNTENLRQPIQMKLSKNLKIFTQFSTRFLNSIYYFESFEEKDESYSLYLSEIRDCEICAYVNV